jgi:transposase
MITIGLDLGDQVSRYCLLDAAGTVQRAGSVRTTREALTRMFRSLPSARVIVEVGTHSPWVSRGLTEAGHEVIVANARRVRLITAATRKSDPVDAEMLARLGRADPKLLAPSATAGRRRSSIWPSSVPATPWCAPARS